MRGLTARSTKGTPAVVVTPTTRAISHTILGAVSASGVVNLEVRVPIAPKRIKVDGARKRKKAETKKIPKGTVTGHYMRFVYKTMLEMYKFPTMKGYYIIMDNAPIHTSTEIEKMIISRG
ncbi:hypothetical protein MFLAVUS_002562 [Mucor flavus]|uniref:Tc1-like transposase DDE domain-containing protein n=1 Tax=Mucor flavus TaxID=439312 RepID=A0ABP9YQL1_9FUNG